MKLPGRKVLILAALWACGANPAVGEDRFELSLAGQPGASYSDFSGFDFHLGVALGAGLELAPGWWADLRALDADADRRGAQAGVTTWQLGARRAFGAGSAWQPFVGFGGHYQRSELEREVVCEVRAPCPPLREAHDDFGAFVGGGVDWRFAQRWRARFEARLAAFDSQRSGDIESVADLTAGLALRF